MKTQVNSLTPSPNSADNVQKTLFLMPKPNRANAHANFQDKSTPIPMHASVQEVDSLLERSAYAPMKTRSGTEGSALDALPEPPFSLQINSATTALKALRLTQLPTVACLHSETDRFVFVILTIHKTFLKPFIDRGNRSSQQWQKNAISTNISFMHRNFNKFCSIKSITPPLRTHTSHQPCKRPQNSISFPRYL